jgi:hypothetical protein
MRASVHIKVPNLTSDGTDTKAKEICGPLGLSVRGTGGEHAPIGADGTIDLSPRARLFIKESEIVAKLYQGIQDLMKAEQAAGGGEAQGKAMLGSPIRDARGPSSADTDESKSVESKDATGNGKDEELGSTCRQLFSSESVVRMSSLQRNAVSAEATLDEGVSVQGKSGMSSAKAIHRLSAAVKQHGVKRESAGSVPNLLHLESKIEGTNFCEMEIYFFALHTAVLAVLNTLKGVIQHGGAWIANLLDRPNDKDEIDDDALQRARSSCLAIRLLKKYPRNIILKILILNKVVAHTLLYKNQALADKSALGSAFWMCRIILNTPTMKSDFRTMVASLLDAALISGRLRLEETTESYALEDTIEAYVRTVEQQLTERNKGGKGRGIANGKNYRDAYGKVGKLIVEKERAASSSGDEDGDSEFQDNMDKVKDVLTIPELEGKQLAPGTLSLSEPAEAASQSLLKKRAAPSPIMDEHRTRSKETQEECDLLQGDAKKQIEEEKSEKTSKLKVQVVKAGLAAIKNRRQHLSQVAGASSRETLDDLSSVSSITTGEASAAAERAKDSLQAWEQMSFEERQKLERDLQIYREERTRLLAVSLAVNGMAQAQSLHRECESTNE